MRRIVVWTGLGALAVAILVAAPRRILPRHIVAASDLGVLPLATEGPALEVPPTDRGRAMVAHLIEIAASTRSGRYAHRTDVDTASGRYHWDCSGMVGWLLRRHAPRSLRAVGRSRPRAADFAAHIAASPTHPGGAWQRIERIEEVRAGDVFAWRTPPALRVDGNTGHSGIVLARPRRIIAASEVWSVRIADSTTAPHAFDSRTATADLDGGLGFGTMTLVVDDAAAVTHVGWVGALSPLYVQARVVFGRVGS